MPDGGTALRESEYLAVPILREKKSVSSDVGHREEDRITLKMLAAGG